MLFAFECFVLINSFPILFLKSKSHMKTNKLAVKDRTWDEKPKSLSPRRKSHVSPSTHRPDPLTTKEAKER